MNGFWFGAVSSTIGWIVGLWLFHMLHSAGVW